MPTTADPYIVRRLINLPPTAELRERVEHAQALLDAAQAEPEIPGRRRVENARRALERPTVALADGEKRDVLQAERPKGCWCLGGGVSREYNGTKFCGCADGVAAEAASDAAALKARQERTANHRELLLDNSEIPQRFWGYTFDSYPSKATASFRRVKEWAQGDGERKNSLLLYGGFGTGKTGLAVAALKDHMHRELDEGLFITVPRLLDRIRTSYNAKDSSDAELVERVQTVDMLVLDDIGAERVTEWVAERLFSVINARHDSMLPTIFTSNLDPAELAGHLGERTAWRVIEMCEVMKLDGPNLRHDR